MTAAAKRILEAVALGAATAGGVLLVHALRDPYSDLRLKAAELHDALRAKANDLREVK